MAKVFLSTGAFQTKSLRELLPHALNHGFRQIELSSGCEYEADLLGGPRERIQQGMDFLVHNYFPPPKEPFVLNLAIDDRETLERCRQHCRNSIDLCVELGSPIYSVHSGFARRFVPKLLGDPKAQSKMPPESFIPYDIALSIFKESVLELREYAKGCGITFLIENNVVSPANETRNNPVCLMTRADEIVDFMNEIGNDSFGLLLDVGHANVSCTTFKENRNIFLEKVAPYTKALHLSDNDGIFDQNLPVSKTSWFFEYLESFLRRAPAETPVVLEAYRLDIPTMKEQWDLLQKTL